MASALVAAAAAFARQAHAGQTRKGGAEPYFVHLESVAAHLLQHGHDDELTLAAAYLHDVLEDQPAFGERLRRQFPDPLVMTVEILTEVKLDAQGNKRPKHDRFRDYLIGLSAETPEALRARVVSCADKIDNALSLVRAEERGASLLTSLSTRPEEHDVHLTSLRPLYVPVVRASLLHAFDSAAHALREAVRAHCGARDV